MKFIKDIFFNKEELKKYKNISNSSDYQLTIHKRQLQTPPIHTFNLNAHNYLINKIQEKFFKIPKFKYVVCDFRKRKTPVWNLNREDKYIHQDNTYWNCLIYLEGPISLYDGTTFYKKINNEFIIQDMIGFKPNRAILFRGNHPHGTSQVHTKNDNWRSTINVFFCR